MTPDDFKAWRNRMDFTQQQAADALGLSRDTIANYERGSRREDNRLVEIPRVVALACAAVIAGAKPYKATEEELDAIHNRRMRNNAFGIRND